MRMDLGTRYEALCLELGHLDLELEDRTKRRAAIIEELRVLRSMARDIRGAENVSLGKSHAPEATAAPPASTGPNGRVHAAHQEET